MSQKPSSFGTGVSGTTGAAAQTVATTKYSVGTSFRNKYGDRIAAITVKCDNAYTLTVYGGRSDTAFSSSANTGAASGELLPYTVTGVAASALDGTVHYVRIGGFRHILPVVYQAGGDDATVTITYQTMND